MFDADISFQPFCLPNFTYKFLSVPITLDIKRGGKDWQMTLDVSI